MDVNLRILAVLLAAVTVCRAQQPLPGRLSAEAKSDAKEEVWKRMTVKEKLRYDFRHVWDPENAVFAAIGAGIDQGRDRPSAWGYGGGAYAERFASHYGQYLIQRSIMFPVQAIDHEDIRYLRSKRNSIQGRVGDAFLHTIWRRKDDGGMMPAYSEFLGDYGAAALSRVWWPAKYQNASSILIAGSDTVLIDGAINVFHEFTPDIKHWLHMRR